MGQHKLERFEAIKHFSNVLEYPENMQGNWHSFFNNSAPITLELACGKGEYTVGLASLYKDRNFIGVDVKGNRIWRGAKTALANNLTNAAFLRTQIDQISNYFASNEVQEIWITFPDPQLRESKARKRLTHPKFLRLYKQFLVPNGIIHLKTDSPVLYQFTKQVIDLFQLTTLVDIENINSLPELSKELAIKTHYEGLDIAQSNKIHYLQFCINRDLPLALDEQLKKTNE